MAKKGSGLLGALIVGVGIYSYAHSGTEEKTSKPSLVKSASAATPTVINVSDTTGDLPYAEQQFIKAVHDGHTAYDSASNDMQKGATRPRRAKAVCAALPSGNAVGWVAKIYKLSSNSDGKGVLELELAPDVWIKTWNNSFSDSGDHTLIDPDSALFERVSAMSNGQMVKFSGTFIRSDTDCLREGSMSISGSMTEPEYIMRFTNVSAP